MEPRQDEDIRLVGAALAGDAEAFRRLLEKHQDPIYDLCLRTLASKEDAEDAAQDTFLILFRHLAEFRPEHKLSNWLYTIALNRCRRQLRKRRILRFLSLDFLLPSDETEGAVREFAAEETPPDAELEREEGERWAQELLASLPDTLREPFLLRHLKKMSYEDVAATLHLSLAAVKVRLHRAKLFLLKRFGPKAEEV